jgi:hypothetical protein
MEEATITFGIKDTKEALIAIVTIFEFFAERLKDGAGIDDVVAIYSKLVADDVFVKKVKDGYSGLKNISKELKDIKTEEITALGYEIAPQIVSLLLKLKKS